MIERWFDDRRRAWWVAIAMITVGVLLRGWLSYWGHFSIDLATSYTTARHIVHGIEFPIVGGTTSWGGRAPLPGLYYLLAPSLIFGDSLRVFLLWGVLLGATGLLAFTALVFERYGPRAGVVAAAWGTFAPWFMVGGDSPWPPKLALACFAWLLFSIHRTVRDERSPWIIGIPLAVAAQAHIYANVIIPVLVILAVWACTRPKLNLGRLLLGVAIGAATMLPSVLHYAFASDNTVGDLGSKHKPFVVARECMQSIYHLVDFASVDSTYNVILGFWKGATSTLWENGWTGIVKTYNGSELTALFVICSFAVAAFAFARALVLGLRAVSRSRDTRKWDWLGVALVAAMVGSMITVMIGVREYHPRYNFLAAWLSLVPLVWLVTPDAFPKTPKVRKWMTLWLVITAPASLGITMFYYSDGVPPYSADTAERVLATVVEEENGKPFELYYARPIAQRGMDAFGLEMYGARWTQVKVPGVAEHRYFVVRAPFGDKAAILAGTDEVDRVDMRNASLLKVPKGIEVPKGAIR